MTIYIPTPLRTYAEGKDAIEITAGTVSDALDVLTQTYPELRKHLFTGEGKLRAFVNLYLNDEDVRYLPQKERSEVSAKDTLSIIPSIAGGAATSHLPNARSVSATQRYDIDVRTNRQTGKTDPSLR
ncbi:MAG: MoaD/ThiS family protein [Terracidiphilus sp.]